jgi:hypothetical protein
VKLRRIFAGLVFVVVAAVFSIWLALQSEGINDHYRLTNGTPGEVVSRMVVPATGLDSLGKSMEVQIAVDAPIWFVLICGSASIIIKIRKRRRRGSPSS